MWKNILTVKVIMNKHSNFTLLHQSQKKNGTCKVYNTSAILSARSTKSANLFFF